MLKLYLTMQTGLLSVPISIKKKKKQKKEVSKETHFYTDLKE